MINHGTIRAANSYIVSQLKHTDEPSRQIVTKITQPFVTISREAGAGGTSVGDKLVEYLNFKEPDAECKWALFEKNLIEKVIEEHNLPDEFRHYMPEEKVSEMQNVFETLMGLHPGISKLASKTCNTILHLASIGNVVLVGRGANIITKYLKGGIHVRIIADSDWKIKHVQSLYEFDRKQAVKFIDEEDTKRKEYVKKQFNKNVDDPLLYDLVIRTGSLSFNEAAEMIGDRVLHAKHYLSLQMAPY